MVHCKRILLLCCCSILWLMAGMGTAWANEFTDSFHGPWNFTVAPYLWFVGQNGNVGVGGRSVSIDDSFIDTMQDSDSVLAFMGNVLVNKGRWTFFAAPTWSKLGSDDESAGPFNFDVTETLTIVGFGARYRVATWNLANSPGGSPEWAKRPITFDILAGGRYTNLNVELDFKRMPIKIEQTKTWVDPIIGVYSQMTLTEDLSIGIRADVGGFGVGSDFTAHTAGLIGYKVYPFGWDWTLTAGYRALYQDYTDGEGFNKFTWDMWLHGPLLGLAINFGPYN